MESGCDMYVRGPNSAAMETDGLTVGGAVGGAWPDATVANSMEALASRATDDAVIRICNLLWRGALAGEEGTGGVVRPVQVHVTVDAALVVHEAHGDEVG